MSALHLAYVYRHVEETLPEARRREVDWSACNPLSFLRFFRPDGRPGGLRMAVLSWSVLLTSVPTDMHDTRG